MKSEVAQRIRLALILLCLAVVAFAIGYTEGRIAGLREAQRIISGEADAPY